MTMTSKATVSTTISLLVTGIRGRDRKVKRHYLELTGSGLSPDVYEKVKSGIVSAIPSEYLEKAREEVRATKQAANVLLSVNTESVENDSGVFIRTIKPFSAVRVPL